MFVGDVLRSPDNGDVLYSFDYQLRWGTHPRRAKSEPWRPCNSRADPLIEVRVSHEKTNVSRDLGVDSGPEVQSGKVSLGGSK